MEKVVNIRQVKNHNVSQVKRALKSIPYGTKNTVAGITGLSIATCNTILNELEESQEILVVESTAPSVGRPPKMYRFNEAYSYICCVFPVMEAGIKRINYAVTDLCCHIMMEDSIEYESITVQEIKQLIEDLMKKEPKIQTVSLGIPGYYSNNCVYSCGVTELNGCDIRKELQEYLGCEVFVENDINAMTYGMCHCEDEPYGKYMNMVLIAYFKGRGSGAGIVLDGKIHHGNTNFAGEINKLYYSGAEIDDLTSQGEAGVLMASSIAIENISAILNPEIVFFTGGNISEKMLADIEERVLKRIPKEHIPKLMYIEDSRKYYIGGLCELVLENSIL